MFPKQPSRVTFQWTSIVLVDDSEHFRSEITATAGFPWNHADDFSLLVMSKPKHEFPLEVLVIPYGNADPEFNKVLPHDRKFLVFQDDVDITSVLIKGSADPIHKMDFVHWIASGFKDTSLPSILEISQGGFNSSPVAVENTVPKESTVSVEDNQGSTAASVISVINSESNEGIRSTAVSGRSDDNDVSADAAEFANHRPNRHGSVFSGITNVKKRSDLVIKLRKKHNIPERAIIDEECLNYLEEKFITEHRGFHILHPKAALILARAKGSNLEQIANEWYAIAIQPSQERRAIVSEEDRRQIHGIEDDRVKVFYEIVGFSNFQSAKEIPGNMKSIRSLSAATKTWTLATIQRVQQEINKWYVYSSPSSCATYFFRFLSRVSHC